MDLHRTVQAGNEMGVFCKKMENGGGCKKWKMGFFCKNEPFFNAGCSLLCVVLVFLFYILLIGGGAYAPNAPPCLRACRMTGELLYILE